MFFSILHGIVYSGLRSHRCKTGVNTMTNVEVIDKVLEIIADAFNDDACASESFSTEYQEQLRSAHKTICKIRRRLEFTVTA